MTNLADPGSRQPGPRLNLLRRPPAAPYGGTACRAPTASCLLPSASFLLFLLLPGHPLAFDEPATVPERAALWPFILAAVLVPGEETALILRRPRDGAMRPAVLATRAAAAVASEIRRSLPGGALDGAALDHARATVAAAISTHDPAPRTDCSSRTSSSESPNVA